MFSCGRDVARGWALKGWIFLYVAPTTLLTSHSVILALLHEYLHPLLLDLGGACGNGRSHVMWFHRLDRKSQQTM